jgi:hypothetical protein
LSPDQRLRCHQHFAQGRLAINRDGILALLIVRGEIAEFMATPYAVIAGEQNGKPVGRPTLAA